MADVSVPVPAPFGDGDDADDVESRAQLILITGLTLAVMFVAVVLLLNTVIYTENLATRGTDAGGGEALDFREDTVSDIGELMDRENRNESDSSVDDDFAATVAAYADRVDDHRIRDGVVADIGDPEDVTLGKYIAQDPNEDGSYRELTSDEDDGESTDWTVGRNVTETRGYRLTLDPESLSDSSSGAFTIVTDNGILETTWELTVYRDDETDDAVLEIDGDEPGTTSETFDLGGDDLHLDLTAGTVNGDEWEELVWAEGVQEDGEPYDIDYRNGDRAAGTYELTVDDVDESWLLNPYGNESTNRSSSPYIVDGVYSATVTVDHRTQQLHYGDTVRIAPGERDE